MKILVVDDEALLVKGIRFNLQNEGYDVITGSDGLEAVRQVQEQHPDLVVLDVMMPNMDGMTACAKIREFSDVPIILLTAKAEDMDKLLGFDQGADDYLTKPFNILELKARIRALLRRSGSPVGLATIYRQLEKLEKSGMLQRIVTEEGAYWQCCEQDDHDCFLLKCEQCGRISHVDCLQLAPLYDHLSSSHHFAINPRRTMLYGVCGSCGAGTMPTAVCMTTRATRQRIPWPPSAMRWKKATVSSLTCS